MKSQFCKVIVAAVLVLVSIGGGVFTLLIGRQQVNNLSSQNVATLQPQHPTIMANGASRAVERAGDSTITVTTGTYTINGGTLSGKTANRGGALYVGSNAMVTLNNVKIEGGQASEGGAIFVENGGYLTLNHCSITGSVSSNGGAIRAYDNSVVNINDCTISQCSGSAAINISTSAVLNVSNCTIDNLPSGFIYAYNSCIISLINTSITNTADAAIKMDWNVSLSARNSTISHCQQAINGGTTSSITLDNCTLSNNYSQSKIYYYGGGAIYANSGTIVKLTNCLVQDNSSESVGGGLFIVGTLISVNTKYINNSAAGPDNGDNRCGGAIILYEGSSCIITGGTFSGNTAGRDGPHICLKYGSIPLQISSNVECTTDADKFLYNGSYYAAGQAINWNG